MNKKSSISFFALVLTFSISLINLEAATVAVPTYSETPAIPAEHITSLDLTYIHGGDFVRGRPFNEEELTQTILSFPNLEELNLTGQTVTPSLMTIIHENLPYLKKLTIKGSIIFNYDDGLIYSWESLNQQTISPMMLEALCTDGSSIEVLDLSLSTIDDHGLEQISQNAFYLKQIYLGGAGNVTDRGILALVDRLPNIQLIDITNYTLRAPLGRNQETIGPKISEDLIRYLLDRGIVVIQNETQS